MMNELVTHPVAFLFAGGYRKALDVGQLQSELELLRPSVESGRWHDKEELLLWYRRQI